VVSLVLEWSKEWYALRIVCAFLHAYVCVVCLWSCVRSVLCAKYSDRSLCPVCLIVCMRACMCLLCTVEHIPLTQSLVCSSGYVCVCVCMSRL